MSTAQVIPGHPTAGAVTCGALLRRGPLGQPGDVRDPAPVSR